MASRYYTPWMARAGQQIGQALETRGVRAQKEQQNKLIQSAYMGDPQAMQGLMELNPQMGMQIQEAVRKRKSETDQTALSKRAAFSKETKEIMSNIAKFDTFEEAQEYGDRMTQDIASRYPEIIKSVGADAVFDEDDFNQAKQIYGSGSGKLGSEQKMFNELTKNLTGEDLEKARRIKLQLDSGAPKIFQASAKTFNIGGVPHILDAEGKVHQITVDGQDITTTVVANSKKEITTATETGKLTSQLKFKPMIAEAVKLADIKAKEKGEVLNDLGRMEASLPGVRQVVSELIDLSTMATSTIGGRAFDFLLKESGFGSTEGANARAKLIAIVDNQVLPLLRETFGAAFTKAEGDTLRMALVDPNASPTQKREQLEAFIAQKERNVRAKQAQLDEMNEIELSDENLLKKYGG